MSGLFDIFIWNNKGFIYIFFLSIKDILVVRELVHGWASAIPLLDLYNVGILLYFTANWQLLNLIMSSMSYINIQLFSNL